MATLTFAAGCGGPGGSEPSYQGKSLTYWRSQLHVESEEDRTKAIEVIWMLGERAKPAAADLVPLLNDKTTRIRLDAVDALTVIGGTDAGILPCVRELTGNQDDAVRAKAATVLGRLRSQKDEAVTILGKSLDDRAIKVRLNTARSLQQLDSDPAVVMPTLLTLAEDADPNIASEALLVLSRFGAGSKEAMPIMIKSLAKQPSQLRTTAAYAIGEIGPEAKPAIPALIQALEKSTKASEFIAEAKTLCKFGPDAKEAIPVLKKSINKFSDMGFNEAIASAVKQIEGSQ
jgi:HEAT repeat protein